MVAQGGIEPPTLRFWASPSPWTAPRSMRAPWQITCVRSRRT